MQFPDIDILGACVEAELRQREMMPLLAATVGVPPEAVYHTWASRRCRQSGAVTGTPWRYFFHGFECDLKHAEDGRFLRLDFGPGGRFDTFSAWGVLQLIITSTAPWAEFAPLKQLFAKTEPPWDEYSGNFPAFGERWDRLDEAGCFEAADPALAADFTRYTTVEPSGMTVVQYPPGTPEETQLDCVLAHRSIMSLHARRLVEATRSELRVE